MVILKEDLYRLIPLLTPICFHEYQMFFLSLKFKNHHEKFNNSMLCGNRKDLPLYGILILSPSYTEEPLGWSGAGVAERVERGRDGRDAGAEL